MTWLEKPLAPKTLPDAARLVAMAASGWARSGGNRRFSPGGIVPHSHPLPSPRPASSRDPLAVIAAIRAPPRARQPSWSSKAWSRNGATRPIGPGDGRNGSRAGLRSASCRRSKSLR